MVNTIFLFYYGSVPKLFLLLFIENFLVTLLALIMGHFLTALSKKPLLKPSLTEWRIYLITIILNTLITCAGFFLWNIGLIKVYLDLSWFIVIDIICLFILMDFVLYAFHFFLHKKILYNPFHRLHHQSKQKPITLFILHPAELLLFGCVWLTVLMIFNFNLYAIILYLVIHIILGVISHLEPTVFRKKHKGILKYLGSSEFHKKHHYEKKSNYGVYTVIWDRLFNTQSD